MQTLAAGWTLPPCLAEGCAWHNLDSGLAIDISCLRASFVETLKQPSDVLSACSGRWDVGFQLCLCCRLAVYLQGKSVCLSGPWLARGCVVGAELPDALGSESQLLGALPVVFSTHSSGPGT